MILSTILPFDQAKLLGPNDRGSCYWQCLYVKKTGKDLWGDATTYDEAVANTKKFRVFKTIIAWSLENRLANREQQYYVGLAGGLTSKCIYSVELYVGQGGQPVGPVNHEACLVTSSDGSQVCFYDPNHGFYIVIPGKGQNNREAFEAAERELYTDAAAIGNFGYSRYRDLKG